jgi:hypothetical protein
MYSQENGLVIEKYKDYPGANNMYLLGGIIGKDVKATAEYGWNGEEHYVTHGYSYAHNLMNDFITETFVKQMELCP